MKRRNLVALVAVSVLFVLGLVAVGTVVLVTRTTMGRDKLRDIIQPLVTSAVKGGSIYIGHLSGNLLTSVSIDSFAIKDKRGDYLVATGRVTLSYNPRDIVDERIYVSRAEIEHPYVHLVQHESGVWNFKEIFASSNTKPTIKDPTRRSFGDYLVFDSVYARNVSFYLSMPWHPDESLRGAARDSVIKLHLTTPSKSVTKTFDGYARTYAWNNGHGLITHARLADPDSDRKFGKQFHVDTLSVDETEPTFKFRRVTADVRVLGDSAWFTIPHFDMPASTGTGKGKVWWGSDLPVRYAINIHGDSVSLIDVNWVYPTLPTTGGGTLDLAIHNDPKAMQTLDPKALQIVDFELQNMNVRSTKSHLVGNMTFAIGTPVLNVQNVDMRADPVDFDLLRTLSGKPFPEDWQGQILGTVKARGGPLTHFVVDDARGTFNDAHVPGAVSRFTGNGELDILLPAFTAFHGFHADISTLDLRTIEYLFPAFPKLGGTIAGTATLDSSWLDVRFSDAHIVHQDGPGEPTRASGSGRITYGTPFMIYDIALDAQPLSATMMSRSFPMPFRGLWSGPIRVKGTSPDLELSTTLQGNAGEFSFDGRVDIDSVGGYGAHGRGQFSRLDIGGVLEKQLPAGTVSGHYDADITGGTLASLAGSTDLELEPTTLGSLRIYDSHARLRFGEGKMFLDSVRIHTAPATIVASGAIGLPQGTPDSAKFSVTIDSLGGLRPFLAIPDTTLHGAAGTRPDSLVGNATISGVATGTLESLNLAGTMFGTDLQRNAMIARHLDGTFDVRDLLGARSGVATLSVDTATVAGIAFDTIGGRVAFDDATHTRFAVGARTTNGPTASAIGALDMSNGATVVALDSLGLGMGESRWHLASPARVAIDSAGMTLDSMMLRNLDTAFISVNAHVPNAGAASANLRASRFPLRDFSTLAQLADTVTGVADLTVAVTGTKQQPFIAGDAVLSAVKWNNVDLDLVTASSRYSNSRLTSNMGVVYRGQTALTAGASLPMDVTLFSQAWRNDSLTAFLRADTTNLAPAEALFPAKVVRNVRGRLSADINASGTLRSVLVDGTASIKDGAASIAALGVDLSDVNGSFFGGKNAAGQDSINADITAVSAGDQKGRVRLEGWARNLLRTDSVPTFYFAAGASSFHAMKRRTIADLYVTATDSLRLRGTTNASVLTGALRVDHGSIFLADADLARKQAVEVLADSALRPASSSFATVQKLMANMQIQNVTVALPDMRLQSKEANVQLAGDLAVVPSTDRSTRTVASTGQLVPRLNLEGVLHTVGGTYNLNLGLVQREFQVLPNGTVTFDGPPLDPTLDIRAQFNVRQQRDRDLAVIVLLQGRLLPYPGISFASNADYEIAQSDLISYLLTGRPGFDFATNPAGQQVLSVLGPSLSAFTADKLRQTFGSAFDLQFQFGAGAQDPGATNNSFFSQYLSGTTIGAGRQLFNNFYVNVNTGFCPASDASGRLNLLSGIGAKVEYRFDPRLSAQFAIDPPTLARTCSLGANISGFVQTPTQFSFSLSHAWRF